MKGDSHEAGNSPYTVETENKYETLEDELDDIAEIADEIISDDSIILQKRINSLKRKKKSRKKTEPRKTKASAYENSISESDANSSDKSSKSKRVVDPKGCSRKSLSEKVEKDVEVNCAELKPSPLMTVNIEVNHIQVSALLDTGAGTNMIQKSVAERINKDVIPEKRSISGLGNSEISTMGLTIFDFSLYGVHIQNTPFHIVDDSVIKVPVILGRKF